MPAPRGSRIDASVFTKISRCFIHLPGYGSSIFSPRQPARICGPVNIACNRAQHCHDDLRLTFLDTLRKNWFANSTRCPPGLRVKIINRLGADVDLIAPYSPENIEERFVCDCRIHNTKCITDRPVQSRIAPVEEPPGRRRSFADKQDLHAIRTILASKLLPLRALKQAWHSTTQPLGPPEFLRPVPPRCSRQVPHRSASQCLAVPMGHAPKYPGQKLS